MNGSALLQLAAATAIFVAAASTAKAWAVDPGWFKLMVTMVLYTAGNLLMLRLIRLLGMATAFSLSSVIQLVAVNGVAILAFGETIGLVKGLGLGMAVLAVALITLGPRFTG